MLQNQTFRKNQLHNPTILTVADGVIVYTISSSFLNDAYWSDESLANEFEKHKCKELLEHYCNNVLLCRYTKAQFEYVKHVLKLKEEISR